MKILTKGWDLGVQSSVASAYSLFLVLWHLKETRIREPENRREKIQQPCFPSHAYSFPVTKERIRLFNAYNCTATIEIQNIPSFSSLVWDGVSLCSPGWSWTRGKPLALAFQVPGSQAWAAMLASSLTGWRTVEGHCSQFEDTVASIRLTKGWTYAICMIMLCSTTGSCFFFPGNYTQNHYNFYYRLYKYTFFITLYLGIRLLISEVDDYLTLLWNSEIVSSVVCTAHVSTGCVKAKMLNIPARTCRSCSIS